MLDKLFVARCAPLLGDFEQLSGQQLRHTLFRGTVGAVNGGFDRGISDEPGKGVCNGLTNGMSCGRYLNPCDVLKPGTVRQELLYEERLKHLRALQSAAPD
jgi:hypothetical protein